MEVAAFDLDRVLFDTNAYMKEIRRRMERRGIDPERVFRKAEIEGRKDLSTIYKVLGKYGAASLLLEGISDFIPKSIRDLIEELKKKFFVVVVSVGDDLQKKKIDCLNIEKFFFVKSDKEKIDIVKMIDPVFFVDDKREVVEKLRKDGIRAYQAVWFLDENYKRKALKDALRSPREILEIAKDI